MDLRYKIIVVFYLNFKIIFAEAGDEREAGWLMATLLDLYSELMEIESVIRQSRSSFEEVKSSELMHELSVAILGGFLFSFGLD